VVAASLARQKLGERAELKYRLVFGERIKWVRSFPVTEPASGALRIVGIVEDITEQHMRTPRSPDARNTSSSSLKPRSRSPAPPTWRALFRAKRAAREPYETRTDQAGSNANGQRKSRPDFSEKTRAVSGLDRFASESL
jgi:hypothetical protein